MNRRRFVVAGAAVFAAGCITSGRKKGPRVSYPADIQGMCIRARLRAKTGIESKNVPLRKEYDIRVVKRKGQKKFGNIWAWADPRWPNIYVGGVTSRGGVYIEVGCHPHTGNEVSFGVLLHEFGHHWLMTNYGIYTHDPRFDDVFGGWSGLQLDAGQPRRGAVVDDVRQFLGHGEVTVELP